MLGELGELGELVGATSNTNPRATQPSGMVNVDRGEGAMTVGVAPG